MTEVDRASVLTPGSSSLRRLCPQRVAVSDRIEKAANVGVPERSRPTFSVIISLERENRSWTVGLLEPVVIKS